MNKIFKVVWSKVKHCYVVVSEIAKNTTSGGARRCRMGKVSLAAAMAAAVLTGSFAMPNSAWADLVAAEQENYIAIGGASSRDESEKLIGGYKYIKRSVSVGNDVTEYYWVREGYAIQAVEGKLYNEAEKDYRIDAFAISGANKADLAFVGNNNIKNTTDATAVNNEVLHSITYKNYGAVTNSAYTMTLNESSDAYAETYDYRLVDGKMHNGKSYIEVDGADVRNKRAEYFKEVSLDSTTGQYMYNGNIIPMQYVYRLGSHIGVFLDGNKNVYEGVVYGKKNEILLTAYNETKGNWTTVWASELTDNSATIGSMTKAEFQKVLDYIHNEDVILSRADVEKTIVTTNEDGGNINLVNKAGNNIPGISITRTAERGSDTIITIADTYDSNISLETGSRVVANPKGNGYESGGNVESIAINGIKYDISAGGTGTMSSWTAKVGDANATIGNGDELAFKAGSNVSLGLDGKTITVDATDTKVVSGSVVEGEKGSYGINLVTNEKDSEGNDVIAPITGLHDYHITGVTVDSANKNVQFNRNNGDSYTLNFTSGGGSYNESTEEYEDTYVQIGGADVITLNTGSKVSANEDKEYQANQVLEDITINGQKYTIAAPSTVVDTNTYVDDVSVGGVEGNSNAAKVNFIHNDGTEGYEVTFVGEGSVNVSTEGENVVISAMDTNTTYTVEESGRTGDDAGNVVKKWNIKSQANGEGAYTDVGTVVDTDTRVTSGSATYDGANGTITLTNNDGTTAPITGLHDYHITGVTVDSANKNVQFNRNNGDPYTLNFTSGGGSYNESTEEHEDTYVQIGGANGIKLNTGSKVTASAIEGSDVLKDITINGDTYTLGWDLQVGGSAGGAATNVQTLKFAEGENVKLDYTNNTITISALVKGYSNDLPVQQQSSKLMANGSEESSKTATQQLKMIEINGELFAVPNIEAVSTSVEGAPILKAVELNGQVYNLDTNSGTMNSWTAKVGDEELNVAEGNVVTYTSDANIVLSAESEENGGGTINVSLSNDITLQSNEGNDTIEIKGSESTIKVGDSDDKQVTINGNQGSIAIGENVAINAEGSATFDKVSIDGANGSVVVGKINITGNGTDGNATITGLTNTDWDGETFVSGRAATEDQLKQAISNVTATLTQSDKYVDYSKTYEVNVENEIVLDVVNSDKDVIIENVAKHSDLGNVSDFNSDLKNSDNSHTSVVQAVNRLDDKVNKGWTAKINGKDVQNIQMGGSQNFVNGKNIELTVNGNDIVVSTAKDVTFEKVTVGDVVVDSDGINAGNKKITNVEAGVEDTDAVNVKQLKEVNEHANLNIENLYGNDQYLDSKINQLGSKVNKVGAGAAALAALHPMDFDPDDKLSFSAGVGNYAGQTATALGAFYRPNEKVMMSIGGTYGNNENMVNMGVSFALDRTNNISNSRTAMAREIVDLREQVATQGQQIAQLVALVNQLTGVKEPVAPTVQPFPDVPANHWAYEYLNNLVAMGVIEGYPDGTFGGDRTMTRYEFATMLFKAMQNGAVLSEQIRQEFNAELGRIRVDRIKGADDDANKIERVRVNNYEDRDDYGSKIVQVKAGA